MFHWKEQVLGTLYLWIRFKNHGNFVKTFAQTCNDLAPKVQQSMHLNGRLKDS